MFPKEKKHCFYRQSNQFETTVALPVPWADINLKRTSPARAKWWREPYKSFHLKSKTIKRQLLPPHPVKLRPKQKDHDIANHGQVIGSGHIVISNQSHNRRKNRATHYAHHNVG